MQKLLPLFLLLLSTGIISIHAQTRKVLLAEYFIDADPGQGNGTIMLAIDGNFDEALEQAMASGISLASGNHSINIRVKDAAGNWSPVFSSALAVEALRTIQLTQAEYFIDADPGQGNGTIMLAIDGNFDEAFEQAFANGITIPSGNHTINIRVKDAGGNWSPVFSSALAVEALRTIQLTQAEYFIDSDPGQGNGTIMLAFDGNFDEALEQAFANGISLTAGNHTINIRVEDASGNWSPVFSSAISVETLRTIQLTQAEYFIDSDPGQGNGSIMFAIDGNFDEALEQAFANGISLTAGNHTINIRVEDASGNWSPVFSSAISVEALRTIQLTQAEYFIDTDPGQGNGSIMFAIDGNFDEALEQAFANGISLTAGNHTINIRVEDASGNWSPVFSSAISVEALRTIQLTQAEYFIDSDPGQGNGSIMLAIDGNFDEALEQAFANGISLTAGNHTINIRVEDAAGNWSPVFSSAISVETLRTIQLTQAEYFIDTDPGQGNGSIMFAIDGNFDEALEQAFTNGITIASGNHTINIRVKDAAGNWSPVFSSAISVEALRTIQLTQAEYFIDSDPGQGNGTIMLAIDGNFDEALEQAFANGITIASGNHTINIRVKDAAGNWSPVFSSAISVEALRIIQLTQAEYFIDSDPGQGNGTIMLAIDGNFDAALEQAFVNGISLTAGNHTINIRVMDAAGNWSAVFSSAITVETLRTIHLSQAEYFWDADPGEGNGTLMIALDGNYDDAFEKISASGITTLSGAHKLSIRIRDAHGNWSPPFSSVIADENYCNNPEICNGIDDNCNSQVDEGCSVTLNLKLFIAGFYSGGGLMEGTPGQGCLNIIDPITYPDPTDADDVTIAAMNVYNPYSVVESQIGRLKTDGSISVNFNGPAIPGESYYIRLTNRNMIETWSKDPVSFTSPLTSYDFTSASTQAYDDGFNLPMKLVDTNPDRWAVFNGDINQDGGVDSQDMTLEENASNGGLFGYYPTDLNGDGGSDSLDMTIIENNGNAGVFTAHP